MAKLKSKLTTINAARRGLTNREIISARARIMIQCVLRGIPLCRAPLALDFHQSFPPLPLSHFFTAAIYINIKNHAISGVQSAAAFCHVTCTRQCGPKKIKLSKGRRFQLGCRAHQHYLSAINDCAMRAPPV